MNRVPSERAGGCRSTASPCADRSTPATRRGRLTISTPVPVSCATSSNATSWRWTTPLTSPAPISGHHKPARQRRSPTGGAGQAAGTLGPFAAFGYQTVDGLSLRLPRLGLVASRRWKESRNWNGALNARGSYGEVEGRTQEGSQSDTNFSYSVSGSIAHGQRQGLRKELEGEVGRNELRLRRSFSLTPGIILPDQPSLGTEDFSRLRASLQHQWRARTLTGWAE